ncbi:MAG: thiamine phosphate synthase [Brevinemataceae bacterium]
MPPFYRLMLLTNKQNTPIKQYLEFIKHCAEGGITSVQLREKNLDKNELIDFGRCLQEVLSEYSIPLVVNDYPEIAKILNSPYIHLGRGDTDLPKAVEILGSDAQIGISIESLEDFNNYTPCPAISYVAASAVFPSSNKQTTTVWEIEGLKKISSISPYPVTAIGGITLENFTDVINAGAQGIAIIGALHDSPNPRLTAEKFKNTIDTLLGER